MPDLCILSVGETAAEELAALVKASFTQAYHELHDPADIEACCDVQYSVASMRANLLNRALDYRVAYDGDRAVGFAMTALRDCPIVAGINAVELKQLYILSDVIRT